MWNLKIQGAFPPLARPSDAHAPQHVKLCTQYLLRSQNWTLTIKTYSHNPAWTHKPRSYIMCEKKPA